MKIFWLSRHDLSPAQLQAIRDLHGDYVEIVKDSVVFDDADGLANYIVRCNEEYAGTYYAKNFVYAVAGAAHYLFAALHGLPFGVFENHPARRQDGGFGLAAVYHINTICGGGIEKVWVNPDPMSDKGEALIPVARC